MLMNLYGKVKTSEMVTVIFGIKNIHFLAPRFLVLVHEESHSDHSKKVNNVIKTLFSGASEEKIAVTQDIFWTDYTDFDNTIG